MPFADRFLRQLILWLPALAVALFIAGILAPGDWSGEAVAMVILVWPPALVIVVLALKSVDAVRARMQPRRPFEIERPSTLLVATGWFLRTAAAGFLLIAVLFACVAVGAAIGGELGELAGVTLLAAVGLWWLILPPPATWELIMGRRDLALARQLTASGKWEDVLAHATRYEAKRPDDPRGWGISALAQFRLGRWEEALADADKSVALERSFSALLGRGLMLLTLGAYEEASADLRASYEMRRLPGTMALLAVAYLSAGETTGAIGLLQGAVQDTGQLWAFGCLGEAYQAQGDKEQARKFFEIVVRKSRELMRQDPASGGILATALIRLGQNEEAERLARECLRQNPDEATLHSTLATAAVRRGDLDEVEAQISACFPENPRMALTILMAPELSDIFRERRFRELFGWAWGWQHMVLARVRSRGASELA